MSNNSIDNIVSSFEFDHKKLAYYRLVRDAARDEIERKALERYSGTTRSQVREAYVKALHMVELYERQIAEREKNNGIKSEYIESLCSLTFDDDYMSEERLKEVVREFHQIMLVSHSEEDAHR